MTEKENKAILKPENVHNQKNNVFKQDGKTIVANVQKCTLYEKNGDEYILECKIKERGKHLYSYVKNSGFIQKYCAGRILYLSEKAQSAVDKAVADVDEKVAEAKKYFRRAEVPELKLEIYYKRIAPGLYEYVYSVRDARKTESVKICGPVTVKGMLHELTYAMYLDHSGFGEGSEDSAKDRAISHFFESKEDTIGDNPLYRSAIEHNDFALQKEIKLYYNLADRRECSLLGRLLGYRVLPPLPAEFDRNCYVDSDTIKTEMLDRSGYGILHRPYFAMKGSTHAVWTLNPHRKSGVDAAPANEPGISFQEFLELFDGDE